MSLHDSKLYLWDLEEILINFFGSENDQNFSDSFAPFRIMDINNSQLIGIEQSQIFPENVASCALDKTLWLTNLESQKVEKKFNFDVQVTC
jgi:hypothetical protein